MRLQTGQDVPADPGSVRIVIVDDHAIVRQGLRLVLEQKGDLSVVGEASSPEEAMATVARVRPDVVLLDLKLSAASDTEGLQVCTALTRDHPDVRVLVLTTAMDDNLVIEVIHRGAAGFVVKDVDTSELVRAVRAVHRGEKAFDAHSAAAMVRTLNSSGPPPQQLTDREVQVLRLLAGGLSNRGIGARLYISETTVKFHVGNIMRKLEVSRRAEAVYAASKLGII